MPRPTKLQLEGLSDEARLAVVIERLIEIHGYEVYAAAINATNSGRGSAESERAYRLLLSEDDGEKILAAFNEWLDPFINERVGRSQRRQAGTIRHPMRKPEDLRAAVKALRDSDLKLYPPNGSKTFSDVCRDVAIRVGYKPSAKAVKQAAKDIQWADPRRRK
jgi:hypothetical protein